MSQEMININVIVADRPYRLKIKPAEEETIRKAARQINDKVKEFQNVYDAKDKQDYLAMATILYAVEALNAREKPAPANPGLESRIAHLHHIIDEALSEK